MATYHENILFTIQKLCFQGAKATKISIFWYPKTPPKQLSGRAGAKMGWGGGAKPAAKQPSWCQDAKISAKLVESREANMSICHENISFIIQKLHLHGAKATKISIFWYPESPRKQLSS